MGVGAESGTKKARAGVQQPTFQQPGDDVIDINIGFPLHGAVPRLQR
jgi:hypothetical protein